MISDETANNMKALARQHGKSQTAFEDRTQLLLTFTAPAHFSLTIIRQGNAPKPRTPASRKWLGELNQFANAFDMPASRAFTLDGAKHFHSATLKWVDDTGTPAREVFRDLDVWAAQLPPGIHIKHVNVATGEV